MIKNEKDTLKKLIEALPQLQCKKCQYDDCKTYAEAIFKNGEDIDKCEPGASPTKINLKKILNHNKITDTQKIPLYAVATIDESQCIGCTICIKMCPVDAIVGAKQQKHFVLDQICNGCELCINECPVDCMKMIQNPDRLNWVWPSRQSSSSKRNYYNRLKRLNEIRNNKKLSAERLNDIIGIKNYLKKAIKRETLKRKKIYQYE